MASQSETGNAKNLAAFQTIITFCKGYGSPYNPGNTNLSTDSLDQQYAAAALAFDESKTKYLLNAKAIDDRQKAFGTIRTYATRIMNAIIAAGADKITLDTAKTFNRKIQGIRAGKPKAPADPNQPQADTINATQLSYDNLIEHFKGLVGLLALLPDYKPNEPDLKITGLNSHIDLLKTTNMAIVQFDTDLSNARLNRDNIFYHNPGSLANTVVSVKAYVKSLYGGSSKEFKQISSIRFNRR